jgi:hypothetical protein
MAPVRALLLAWIAMCAACACTSKARRQEKERTPMARPLDPKAEMKPLDPNTPASPPLAAYSYQLTGAIQGMVTINPSANELEIMSNSSKSKWTQHYRVRATVESQGGHSILRCAVRANESSDWIELILGEPTKVAPRKIALQNDAGEPWGELTFDGALLRVTDATGRTRVEIGAAGAAGAEGIALVGAGGGPAFRARVLDAQGAPVQRGELLQP